VYYEADGLSFMPIVRMRGAAAELCIYYQNRYDSPVEAVVHLHSMEPGFEFRPGWRDVHFAFKADGGDFGVIHQPIVVTERFRGEVVAFQLAAATSYPRGRGSRVCRGAGVPCGSLLVDWTGAAFRTGVHQVSGEVELVGPVTLHLSMPDVRPRATGQVAETWYQERLHALA
jgi:hypothetical protein